MTDIGHFVRIRRLQVRILPGAQIRDSVSPGQGRIAEWFESRDPPITLHMTLFLPWWASGARDRCANGDPGSSRSGSPSVWILFLVGPCSARSGFTAPPMMPKIADT